MPSNTLSQIAGFGANMPYIKKSDKDFLEPELFTLICKIRASAKSTDDLDGLCNYAVSTLVAGVMKPHTGWRYHWLHRAYGVFGAAGAEFYRRLVAPYEDKAIEKNGDIESYV